MMKNVCVCAINTRLTTQMTQHQSNCSHVSAVMPIGPVSDYHDDVITSKCRTTCELLHLLVGTGGCVKRDRWSPLTRRNLLFTREATSTCKPHCDNPKLTNQLSCVFSIQYTCSSFDR